MGFLKRAINNLTLQPPSPPQGVAMSKIAEITVTSSVQSVTFSGLNGNTDLLYWLVGWNLGVTGSSVYAADLQFNGDTNSSHYITLRVENRQGSLNIPTLTNEPGVAVLILSNGNALLAGTINYYIYASMATGRVGVVGQESANFSNGLYWDAFNSGWWVPGSGVTNVTSITLVTDASGVLWRAGSYFALWAPRTV